MNGHKLLHRKFLEGLPVTAIGIEHIRSGREAEVILISVPPTKYNFGLGNQEEEKQQIN